MSHTISRPLVLAVLVCAVFAFVVTAGSSPSRADDAARLVCPLALHEERLELRDAVLGVELSRSSFAAFEEIYQLIADLLKGDAIDRMTYLRARYDRDAAKLALERADLLLVRQEALIEQLRLVCGEGAAGDRDGDGDDTAAGGERSRKVHAAYLRYRRADCDQQAKAIEVAETNLAFNRQWLASILDLRQQLSTRQDVIRAELDVQLEEQRRADAIRRTEECRAELTEMDVDGSHASPAASSTSGS